MTTATEIANKALTRIGVKTFDNAVDAGVLAQVLSSLTDLHEMLIDLPNPPINWDLDDIPPSAVGPLVDELAWYVRDDFSLPEAKKTSLQVAQQVARVTLYTLMHIPDDGAQTEINAY